MFQSNMASLDASTQNSTSRQAQHFVTLQKLLVGKLNQLVDDLLPQSSEK